MMKKRISQIALLTFTIFAASAVFAQAVDSMSLKLDNLKKTSKGADPVSTLDLLAEAKAQNPVIANLPDFDLNRVEVSLKTGLGGASVALVVNGRFVDSQAVESADDQLDKAGGESKVSLKNIERRITTALLSVIGKSSLRSVTIFFGAIQDVAVLGAYQKADANRVAQAGASPEPVTLVRPPKNVVLPNGVGTSQAATLPVEPDAEPEPNPVNPQVRPSIGGPTILTPQIQTQPSRPQRIDPWATVRPTPPPPPPPPQPTWEDLNCAGQICVGDTVTNSFNVEGKVLRAIPSRGLVEVQFGFQSRPSIREVRLVRLKSRGH